MKSKARQAHRALALFIGLFVIIHFATHGTALLGIDTHDDVLGWARAVYQVPLVEIALVGALFLQIILGITLVRRILRSGRSGVWHWIQVASGSYLAFFMLFHTAAALISRLAVGLDTNFFWAAGSLVIEPLVYIFVPYYVLAVAAIAAHLLAALHFRSPRRWHGPALVSGPLLGLLFVAGYGGVFFAVDLPREYFDYFDIYPGVEAKAG
jgi:hypothetical protein